MPPTTSPSREGRAQSNQLVEFVQHTGEIKECRLGVLAHMAAISAARDGGGDPLAGAIPRDRHLSNGCAEPLCDGPDAVGHCEAAYHQGNAL